MPDLSAQIAALVKELRNSRDVEANWEAFGIMAQTPHDFHCSRALIF